MPERFPVSSTMVVENRIDLGLVGDFAGALPGLQHGVEQGHTESQWRLGVLYARGLGVTEDDAKAKRLIHKAAEQGLAEAQFTLGTMYATGSGIVDSEDYSEAARWLTRAIEHGLTVEQGLTQVQFMLGTMYHEGNGVSQNYFEAVRWYRLAAEQGNTDAQFYLGFMYANGAGIPEDAVYAYAWYSIAAAQSNETANEIKEAITLYMTRSQIAEAQILSRKYWVLYVLPFQ